MWHTPLISALGRQKQVDLCEFKASLVYRMSSRTNFKKAREGAGEIAHRLRALPALPKVLSSIPSNDMVAHNHL